MSSAASIFSSKPRSFFLGIKLQSDLTSFVISQIICSIILRRQETNTPKREELDYAPPQNGGKHRINLDCLKNGNHSSFFITSPSSALQIVESSFLQQEQYAEFLQPYHRLVWHDHFLRDASVLVFDYESFLSKLDSFL